MREKAEQALRQMSLFYGELLDEKKIKQDSEAFALGVSQTYVARSTNPDADTNLSAGLIHLSNVGVEITQKIAADLGYSLVPHKNKLNGSTKDEQAAVLRAIAKLTEGCDDKCQIKQWEIIRKQSSTALKELGQ